ncbi:MAG: stage III sporulation protein AG [Clostridiales bacterium]|nr:stage III sporulation protein AG [Clostridiales bacterium]
MNSKKMTETLGKVWSLLKKNKYVMAVLLVGLVLILLPTGAPAAQKNADRSTDTQTAFSLSEQENRIAAALSKIEGAGRVTVVLTLQCSEEHVLAKDESESRSTGANGASPESSVEKSSAVVIVSAGSSVEAPVTLKYIYPRYQGALVVCEGADNAAVRLQLVRAVSGLTGLGSDKIIVTKMNKS